MTTYPEFPVTTEFLSAVRKAVVNKDYSKRHYVGVRVANGTAAVYLGEETDMGEGYDPRYVSRRVEQAALPSVEQYNGEGFNAFSAGDTHHQTSPTSALRTLSSLAKVGDTLRVYFQIGNNTETLNKAGLSHDLAFIAVYRKGKIVGDVFVDDVIAPTGSLARFGRTQ